MICARTCKEHRNRYNLLIVWVGTRQILARRRTSIFQAKGQGKALSDEIPDIRCLSSLRLCRIPLAEIVLPLLGAGASGANLRLLNRLFTENRRLSVPHRFSRRCGSPVRADSCSAHTRTEYPRRMCWLFRPRGVRAGSPPQFFLPPTKEVRILRKMQRVDVLLSRPDRLSQSDHL
jgi:hypothetical protein